MSLHNKHFYFGTIKKYVVIVGNLFNSIHVVRFNSDGEEVFREKTPITYGPKEKYLYRTEQNPDLSERFSIKLPRISYELLQMKYDAGRKTPSTNKLRRDTIVDDKKQFMYNAVPYDFIFEVNIMAKNSDEVLQMVEQIVPFFTPDYTLTANILPQLEHKLDIPIIIDSIATDDTWNSDFSKRRSIVWTIQMTLKGFLYAPIRDSKVILQADWTIEGFDGEVYSSGSETEQ